MNERRANLIAELIKHLETLDGDELQSKMGPAKVEIDLEGKVPMEKTPMDKEKGPMEMMVAEGGGAGPKMVKGDDVSKDVNNEEMDDDEFEEMMKTHGG